MSAADGASRPKWNKIPLSAWGADFSITDEAFHGIEKAAGISFNGEQRTQIRQIISRYHEDRALQAAAVRPSRVREPLHEIARLSRELRHALSRKKGNPAAEGALVMLEMEALKADKGSLDLGSVLKVLGALERYAMAATVALPIDKGPDVDRRAPGFIREMHSIFKSAGGRGTYTDEAIKYLAEAYRLAGGRLQSEDAFRKLVQNAMRDIVTAHP